VLEERGPAAALHRGDSMLARRTDERVASAFMASVDPREGLLTYSLAGHSSPVLLRAGAHPVLLDAAPSTVLGRGEGRFDERTTDFGPDDLLLMYTDGLVSARSRDDRQFGDERLLDAVASYGDLGARRLPEALFSEVFSFTQGRIDDDLAMVALRPSAA
jgi:sigma-B regulation protein RsbU (phosphoserine phosphatase)